MIDDELMEAALKATALKSKRAVVEERLRLLVKRREQQAIRALRSKVTWEGDLDEMRSHD